MPICISKPSAVVLERQRHHTGIVDQEVDPGIAGPELSGRGPNRRQGRQIQPDGADGSTRDQAGDPCRRLPRLRVIPAGEHDAGAVRGQDPRRLVPEAGIGTGDHGRPAGLIGYAVPVHGLSACR